MKHQNFKKADMVMFPAMAPNDNGENTMHKLGRKGGQRRGKKKREKTNDLLASRGGTLTHACFLY